MTDQSQVPERNSAQWRRNEKLIARDKSLRHARDISQGLGTSSDINTQVPTQKYKAGYDQIDWSKK